jgi:hypothetical protein
VIDNRSQNICTLILLQRNRRLSNQLSKTDELRKHYIAPDEIFTDDSSIFVVRVLKCHS